VDENEPLDVAAARELQEETSVDPNSVLLMQVSLPQAAGFTRVAPWQATRVHVGTVCALAGGGIWGPRAGSAGMVHYSAVQRTGQRHQPGRQGSGEHFASGCGSGKQA
jgi:ADP-ribose pyrophosphatase YjhB (NUDIX family)